MSPDTETAADLVRSPIRIEILKRLREGDRTKYELREELSCVRTTVDRNLDRLAADGWIAETEGAYALTTSGEIVLDSALEFLDAVELASHLQPVLELVPREELDFDLRHLADAEITVAGEGQPMAMLDKHVATVEQATTTRTVIPVTSSQPVDVQYRKMQNGELDAEHVVSPTVAELFRSNPQFTDRISALLDSGQFEVYVTEEEIPFFFGVLDETIQIGANEDGQPRALLETDDERVREWALAAFETYRESAVPFEEWTAK